MDLSTVPVGVLLTLLLLVIPVWRILRRAGMHPAWSLLLVVPYVGFLIVYLMLAFRRWPAAARAPVPTAPGTAA